MGCRIPHRQAHPPARTAAESDDIDVRFIAEAVRAAVSRVIRQGVGATDRVALVPDLLTGSRSPRWAPRADRIGVGPAMYHFDRTIRRDRPEHARRLRESRSSRADLAAGATARMGAAVMPRRTCRGPAPSGTNCRISI